MANNLRVSGAYVSAGVEGPPALVVSGAYVYAGLVGPLSTVPPLARVSGAYLSVGVEGPPKLEVSGAYVYIGLIGPLSDPVYRVYDYENLLPAMAARDQALGYFTQLYSPISTIWDDVAWIAASFADISLACEGVLDLLGDLEGEPRSGLTDTEYRQVIQVRRAAKYGRHSLPAVYTAFINAAGLDATNAQILRLPPASVLAWADVPIAPSFNYLRRAGSALADVMPSGYEITALLAVANSLYWSDAGLFWDTNNWAYTFRST